MNTSPSFSDIKQALVRIEKKIHKTPVFSSSLLNELLGCQLFFKGENFQKAGAFKSRGAINAIACLTKDEKRRGVITHSSGNHAGALSRAAQQEGIAAHIIMPENAPAVKVAAVKHYNGKITFCQPSLEAREATMEKVRSETGATFIHPYNNFNVICGQGTCVLELGTQIEQPDIVIAPIGGGGLMSGTAIASKAIWPSTEILGAEPLNASDAKESFEKGMLIPVQNPNTIADGLRTSLSPLTYSIISSHCNTIFTAKEETIKSALRLVNMYLKIVIEHSSAVPLAAIMENKNYFKGKKIALIISGGNIDG
jgi:threonine dehydratase